MVMENFVYIPSSLPDFQKRIDERIFKEIAQTSLMSSAIYLCLYLTIGLLSPLFLSYTREALVFGVLLGAFGMVRCVLAYQLGLGHNTNTSLFKASFFASVLCMSTTWGFLCAFIVHKYNVNPTSMIVLFATAGIAGGSILSLGNFFPLIASHLSLLLLPTVYILLKKSSVDHDARCYAILTLVFFGYLIIQSQVFSGIIAAKVRKAVIIEDQNRMLAAARSKHEEKPHYHSA